MESYLRGGTPALMASPHKGGYPASDQYWPVRPLIPRLNERQLTAEHRSKADWQLPTRNVHKQTVCHFQERLLPHPSLGNARVATTHT
jgi:hypothetical protein